MPKSHLNPEIEDFVAGGIAGAIADTFVHPLDTINLRLKVQIEPPFKYNGFLDACRITLREEGIRGFYRGLSPTLIGTVPSNAVCFGVYEVVKRAGENHVSKDFQPGVHFVAGALGTLGSSVVYQPMEVVRSRYQLPPSTVLEAGKQCSITHSNYKYKGVLDTLVKIGRTEGMRGLYAGYVPTITLDVCYTALQFAIWEQAKLCIRKNWCPDRELNIVEHLGAGAVAGAISAFVTNPLDVVACRLMTQGENKIYRGTWHCLKSIAKTEGTRGLFAGAVPRVMSIAPLAALAFCIYEQIHTHVFNNERAGLLEVDEVAATRANGVTEAAPGVVTAASAAHQT
eukprot:GFYU01014904.1.p1 GENE.GFYU01014904.1~~GFYU01014904.1.p1  ORF type:complete len:341 (-),score=55.31 GFYU01014904.1:126-1148(-)